jgi:hypothetical protein
MCRSKWKSVSLKASALFLAIVGAEPGGTKQMVDWNPDHADCSPNSFTLFLYYFCLEIFLNFENNRIYLHSNENTKCKKNNYFVLRYGNWILRN